MVLRRAGSVLGTLMLLMAMMVLQGCDRNKISVESKNNLDEAQKACDELQERWADHAAHLKPVDDTEANRADAAKLVANFSATIASDVNILAEAQRAVKGNGEIRSDFRELLNYRTTTAKSCALLFKSLSSQFTRDGTEDERKQFDQWKLDVQVKLDNYAAKLKALNESVTADYAKKDKKKQE